MAEATELARRLRAGIERVVVGNERTIFAFLIALLGGGHILVEGVPGTAKTLFVRLLARLLGVDYRRIQFTPDLMPPNVVGTTVFNPKTAEFALRKGPIFTSLLLADEINRTPPKTQSALLEAMEERPGHDRRRAGGTRPAVPRLRDAEPDRVRGDVSAARSATRPFPRTRAHGVSERGAGARAAGARRRGVRRARTGRGGRSNRSRRATSCSRRSAACARRTSLEPIVEYVQAIVARTRTAPELALGASPRAAIALLVAAQAAAAIGGAEFVTPDDVKDVAPLVLPHRLIVRPEAEIEGAQADAVVARVLASVDVPKQPVAPAP